MSSLLEPTSAPSLLAPLDFDFTTSPLLSSQTANDGYASDQSIAQNTASPSSHSSVSDQWGESPSCVVSSTLPDSRPRLDVVQPSDISIDVGKLCTALTQEACSNNVRLLPSELEGISFHLCRLDFSRCCIDSWSSHLPGTNWWGEGSNCGIVRGGEDTAGPRGH